MKKYQDKSARSIHEMMEGCYKAGLLSAAEMHEFDVDCLVPSAIPNREASSYSGNSLPAAPVPAVAAART